MVGLGAEPIPPDAERAGRRALVLALALALVPYLLLVWRFWWSNDDAFISFRYSRHLVEGLGLRFNPGTEPPVEGYSNFLWVVWLALLAKLGCEIPLAALVSSTLCGVALVVWTTVFLWRRLGLGGPSLAAAALVLGTLPPVFVYSTSGLASMPLALLVFGTFERLSGDPRRPRGLQAGLLALLAALVRADGVGYVALVLAAAGIRAGAERRRDLGRAVLACAAVVAVGVAAHVAWRYSYYHDVVPNTARLKGDFSPLRFARGWRYVVATSFAAPVLALAVPAGIAALGSRTRWIAIPSLVVLGGSMVYAVYVGGDFLPFGRFLVPAAPFAVLCIAAFWHAHVPRVSARLVLAAALVALSLLPAWNLHVAPRSLMARFHFRWTEPVFETEYESWRKTRMYCKALTLLGKALDLCTKPGESIMLYGVGAAGFHCDLVVYDLYGLTSREAAEAATYNPYNSAGHDKAVPWTFFLDRDPTYVSAVLTKADHPVDLSPLFATNPWMRDVRIERHPVSTEHGFQPDTHLVLGRLVRGSGGDAEEGGAGADAAAEPSTPDGPGGASR